MTTTSSKLMEASGPFLPIFPMSYVLLGKYLRTTDISSSDGLFTKPQMEFRCLSQIKAENLRGTLQMVKRTTMGRKILLRATF